jgi:hypothetical protein
LLALKLLDKERRSHISDFNFDEALGLFAGLNILPKTTFATDYSYRTQRGHQHRLLAGWLTHLAPLLLPEASTFCLDFHPIPYRGDPTGLDAHYITQRGHAGTSVLTFFAHEPDRRVLCYANANLTRAEQPGELMRFVEFWHAITGHDPQWLYFDSKLVPYAELSRVNQRGIWFVTIRRRGAALLRRLQALPPTAWRRAVIDIPKAATNTSAMWTRRRHCVGTPAPYGRWPLTAWAIPTRPSSYPTTSMPVHETSSPATLDAMASRIALASASISFTLTVWPVRCGST